jgi:hypothetical protein
VPLITPGARIPEQLIDARGSGPSTATFTDPNGVVWPMSDPNNGWVALADGMSGLGAVPRTLTTDPHPRGGARLRHIQPEARTIVWPLLVKGRDHQEFLDRWHALAGAFTLTNRLGPGILEFQHPDGSRRQIECYYQEGFEGRGKPGYGRTYDVAVITLWCGDPYWVDPDPHTFSRAYSTTSGEDFLVSFPSLSSGQVLGATEVTNTGDVVMWPEWRISGPASSVVFTNNDSGETFTINPATMGAPPLVAGEYVTVTTDPPRVRKVGGEVQTIGLGAATAGTVTITFNGQTTASIARNASLATIKTALENLSNIDPGDVVLTGGPFPAVVSIQFVGQYLGVNVPQITATPTGLTGGTVTIATTVPAGSLNWIGSLSWPGATLWGLEPGKNNVTFTLNGAGAGSGVDLEYHPRYETV